MVMKTPSEIAAGERRRWRLPYRKPQEIVYKTPGPGVRTVTTMSKKKRKSSFIGENENEGLGIVTPFETKRFSGFYEKRRTKMPSAKSQKKDGTCLL